MSDTTPLFDGTPQGNYSKTECNRVLLRNDTRVTILLASYNGATHLSAQLMSYVHQNHPHWDLWISDDGSTDDTRAMIEQFRMSHGTGRNIRILEGPRKGAAANFMSLLTHPDLPIDRPVALSDQDDVWHPNKLSRALEILADCEPVTLYSGQSHYTDADLTITGASQPPKRAVSFENALTQNVVSGHSIVMGPEALTLVRAAGVPQGISYHDWWLYLLVSAAAGTVFLDSARMIYYRQHRSNMMGAHQGWHATLHRLKQVMGKTYGGWIAANIAALRTVPPALLTAKHTKALTQIHSSPPGPMRALSLWRLGAYRQSRAASAVFYLATFLGRI